MLKKTLNGLVLSGLLASAFVAVPARADGEGYFENFMKKAGGYAVKGYVDTQLEELKKHLPSGEYVKRLVQGESKLDSIARLMVVSGILYLCVKPLMKEGVDFKTFALGGLGYACDFLKVDKFEVGGHDLVKIVKEHREQLIKKAAAAKEAVQKNMAQEVNNMFPNANTAEQKPAESASTSSAQQQAQPEQQSWTDRVKAFAQDLWK